MKLKRPGEERVKSVLIQFPFLLPSGVYFHSENRLGRTDDSLQGYGAM